MCGTTARALANALVRFSSSIRFHVASSVSTRAPPAKPPTPATSTSRRPRVFTTRSVNPVMAGRLVTSTASVTRRPRSACATRSPSRSRSCSTAYGTATAAPSARRRSVTAWPRAPVPPVTIATRFSSGLFSGGRSHDGGALDVGVADLRHIERLEVLAKLPERLVEGRERLALAGEGRRPRQHVVLHVRVVDPALLDLLDHVAERFVGGADQIRTFHPLFEPLREPDLQELVNAPEDRREGAAGEALVLLVEEAERDEVRRLE